MVDFCRFFGWLVLVQDENIHLTNFDVAVRRCTVSLSLRSNLYIVHCLTGDHPHASIAKFEASRLCFVVNEYIFYCLSHCLSYKARQVDRWRANNRLEESNIVSESSSFCTKYLPGYRSLPVLAAAGSVASPSGRRETSPTPER